MNQTFLETKFHIPPWRAGSISRPRLVQRLNAGLEEGRSLTLISAPAGYGKTTLVAEWIHSSQNRAKTAWLSLDDADNDLGRFLSYAVAALCRKDESLGCGAQNLLQMTRSASPTAVLDAWINELAALQQPVCLVLDDYHVIARPEIHEALEYCLDHHPPHFHWVITTRADPPLSLARLRARQQMTEIRAQDLRFTPQEAHQFFAHSTRSPLPAETLQALETRTEGWAVGLQLAALALQNRSDPQAFVETFRGSHRYVLDYLAEEVLHQQSEEMQRFLIQTSILDRLNASVCEALTGQANSQALLTHLEQANLFIIPLDDQRGWYRYHHLFADYLRTGLSSAESVELQRKAALWHEAQGSSFEAVRYALASKQPDFAAEVIQRALERETTWSGGNVALLSSWLDALPAQALRSRPQLSLNASRILYLCGRFDQADKCIAQTEEALQALPPSEEVEEMRALAHIYRGAVFAVRGKLPQALEETAAGQMRLSPDHHLGQARAFYSLGLVHEHSAQFETALRHYLRASEEAETAGVLFLAIHARCAAAQLEIRQGRLGRAEQICRTALAAAENTPIPPLGLAKIILGSILLERNQLEDAQNLLEEGTALARQGGLTDDVISGWASLAHLCTLQNRLDEAEAAVQSIRTLLTVYDLPHLARYAGAYLARLHLYTGRQAAAETWAADYRAVRAAAPFTFGELTLARVLLAAGAWDDIPAVLEPILEQAQRSGENQTVIEAAMLLARCRHARRETQAAVAYMLQALRLAAPEGYTRLFLDEGPPMQELLRLVRPQAPAWADALLSAIPGQPASNPASPANALPDPLSEQEMRVLALIMEGQSNQEIADQLVISVGTAKWHVHNVLQKLGAKNRPQAIARARELGF